MKIWDVSIFLMWDEERSRQLRLGWVGGESLLLEPFNGQWIYFEITPDEQDVIVQWKVPK